MRLRNAIVTALPFVMGLAGYVLIKLVDHPVVAHIAVIAVTFIGLGIIQWLEGERRFLEHLKWLGSQPRLGLRIIAAVALCAMSIALVGFERDWEWVRFAGFFLLSFIAYFIVFQNALYAHYGSSNSCS